MITIDVNHPDVLEFVKIKRDLTKVTGANISIRLNDEFMRAVEKGSDYILRYPCDIDPKEYVAGDLEYDKLTEVGKGKYVRRVNVKELWDEIVKSARDMAEPGLMFWDRVLGYDPAAVYEKYTPTTSNPCFRGDTLIAVGDGRNAVTIKQLAEEGRDVPVHSVNKHTGEISIKTGFNPRKTRENVSLVRVHLDNDTYLDVTPDHKFLLRNGYEKMAKELVRGDSLPSFSKRAAQFSSSSTSPKEYYRMKDGQLEHRMIAKYYKEDKFKSLIDEDVVNGWVKGGVVVHHKDYDSLNNSIDNLEVMSFKEHQQFHADHDNAGEKNGKWSGFSNKELEAHAVKMVKELGRRFSSIEWEESASSLGMPKSFSSYRTKGWFKSPKHLSVWAANKVGVEHVSEDPRVVRTYMDMLEQGYSARISDGVVEVEKICEYSGEPFWVDHNRRNACYATPENFLADKNSNEEFQMKRLKGIRKGHKERAEMRREAQAKAYSDLAFKLNRKPLMKEWEEECKKRNLPFRVGKKLKYGYKSYKEVVEAGTNYNHKVSRIEFLDVKEDVYNITVEDNHTVAIITKVYKNKSGNDCYSGIYTPQCGEQFLNPRDSCRLLAVNLFSFVENAFKDNAEVDFRKVYEVFYKSMRIGDDLIDLEVEHIDRIIAKIKSDPEPMEIKAGELDLWEKTRETCISARRVGLGITALGDMIAALGLPYDSDEALEVTSKVMKTKMEAELDCLIDLAILRGTFKGWDWEKEYEEIRSVDGDETLLIGTNKFYRELQAEFPDIVERMRKHGRRSANWSTIAPTGSLSILTQTTSGCEPLFQPFYMRRKKINPSDPNVRVDFVDDLGDKWQEFPVLHPKFRDWVISFTNRDKNDDLSDLEEGDFDILFKESPWYESTANDIDWIKRVEMQSVLQKYTSNSISSTLNLPEDVTYEEVNDIYMESWKRGLKGVTIYRDGSRSGVLVTNKDKYERPDKLGCSIHHTTSMGSKYTILIGFKDDKPFEIFCIPANMATSYKEGSLVKEGGGSYTLYCGDNEKFGVFKNITDKMTPDQQNLTRAWSLLLKSGVPVHKIVEQIEKTTDPITGFSKAVARVLGTYIPDGTKSALSCTECGSKNVVFEEGCSKCLNCGSSACG